MNQSRGTEIRRRRQAHGIKSVHQFADKSGVSRDAITAAEAGTASTATYERLEAWLDRYDAFTGNDEDDQKPVIVRATIAAIGVEFAVEGPVEDLAELEAAVERLVRGVLNENDGKTR
jgi:transcriptional regulator with XRE-family HTH domain